MGKFLPEELCFVAQTRRWKCFPLQPTIGAQVSFSKHIGRIMHPLITVFSGIANLLKQILDCMFSFDNLLELVFFLISAIYLIVLLRLTEKPNNRAITGQRMRMTAKGRKL